MTIPFSVSARACHALQCIAALLWMARPAHAMGGDSALWVSHSTYLGGSGEDVFRDCTLGSLGDIVLVGYTSSANFPVPPSAFDSTYNGAEDALIVRVHDDLSRIRAATYLGGTEREKNTYGVDLGPDGSIYACGETRSSNFPFTPGALQQSFAGGESDAFVARLAPMLDGLLYATYLGGTGDESARGGMVVDGNGRATIMGWTTSHDFPTTLGTPQPAYGGGYYDAFLSRVRPDGSALVRSTFLGGSFGNHWTHSEYVVGAKLDESGRIYFTGSTTSSDFPTTPGAYDRTHSGNGMADGFVGRISTNLGTTQWLTFVAGGGQDWVEHQMALDAQRNVFITGSTESDDFPVTPGAAQMQRAGGADIFLAKIAHDGTALLWATYLGGSGLESAFGIHLDGEGNVYVGGYTDSDDFPVTANAFQRNRRGGRDAIVARVSADGGKIDYATYLGGSGDDLARFLTGRGSTVYVTGHTTSADFPTTPGALQSTHGGGGLDAFVARFEPFPYRTVTYCTGKTNSLGCVPFISTSGLPSASSPDPFVVRAYDALPTQPGFLLYSLKKARLDFHGGRLCVRSPLKRLLTVAPVPGGSPPCSGVLVQGFNQWIQSGVDPLLTVGERVYAQWKQRDPADPLGFGDSLSNGVHFAIGP